MKQPTLQIFIFIVLLILASLLRFYHLGTWSHGFDEDYTTMETHYFFENQPIPSYMFRDGQFHPETSQFSRLPRMIIAAYFVHWIDYRLFGDNEQGSRILPAIMGSFCVGIVFLLGQPLFGFSGSLILAVLILLLPDHILQSQDNRFYSQAFFCISVVLLLGGHVAVRRSAVAAVCLGPVAVLMVLTHSLTGLIWGFLLIGLLVDFLWAKQTDQNNNSRYQNNKSWKNRLSWKMILILGFLVTWSILLLVIAFVHIMPLAKSWNNFETSSVSPIHAVIGLGFSLGWFLFLLCVPAWLFVLGNSRQPGNSYWLVCAVASGISVFLLPLKIAYISHYNFLFTFPILVILSLFIDWLARLVIQSDLPYRKLLSPLLVIMVLLSNFPALASYYQDGGRYEWRAAYQFIREHWQPGDRIACFPLSANRYIPELEPKIPVRSKSETELQQIFDQNRNNRLWIPIACNRYEPDEKRRHWLYNNARYQTRFGKKRYDFTRNDIEIFLVQKTEEEY